MDYNENPPKNLKDQLFIEDMVKEYVACIGLKLLAEAFKKKLDAEAYSYQNYSQTFICEANIRKCDETLRQINKLLERRPPY